MRIQPGTIVGPYTVLDFIAAGGMGEVYRAEDPRLGRNVAIKIIGNSADSDRFRRFETEARATAILAHPNIVTIFDIGTHDGLPFFVCELLEGQTLRQRLNAGHMEATEVVALGLQLTRGVGAAHSLKIIHRDLKPENIFITRDETLKILDFGLAKLRPEMIAGAGQDGTTVGAVFGTMGYMAPEQLRGDPVDERADVFALGAILYEMVSGKQAFRRTNPSDTIAAVLTEQPPSLESAAGVPPGLVDLILGCLEKKVADRVATAQDVARKLEAARADLHRSVNVAPTAESDIPSSIAVLPFADMSPARDQEYFCDGLAEELINSLSHIDGLRVAARSSSFQFRSSDVDVQAVGARLGVSSVLEGGLRKSGDRIRVTVQLVDVANGYQRWSHRFDGKLEDVFAIQDEIAESVATRLRGILSPAQKDALHRPAAAIEAYEHFLRGCQIARRGTRTAFQAARQWYEQSIELDPDYAPAHAGLAEVHAWFYEWWEHKEEDFEVADRASLRALELAPDLSDAHASRGFVLSLRHRYEEAAEEFEEALRLNPQSFDAYYLFARMCYAWGKIAESADLFRRAGEVRPEDFQSLILLGQSLRQLERKEEAFAACKEGIRRVEQRLELDPIDPRALSLGANAYEDIGKSEKALRMSRRAVELYPDDQTVLVNAACLHAKAGNKEEAIKHLEQTFALGFGKRDWVENDPDYDSIRDDPRFQAMLDKLS